MIDEDTKNTNKSKTRKKMEIKTGTDLLKFYDYPNLYCPKQAFFTVLSELSSKVKKFLYLCRQKSTKHIFRKRNHEY
jgi:hypothetical protein